MFYVYVIFNRARSKIYIGQTCNLLQRLSAHNDGSFSHSYTAKLGGKWELIYQEVVPDRSSALKREQQLKSHKGRDSLKQFIPR